MAATGIFFFNKGYLEDIEVSDVLYGVDGLKVKGPLPLANVRFARSYEDF